MRRVIVNADDFGLTVGVNRAIVEAHEEGIVSSTTLMANAQAFDDAVKRVRLLTDRQPRMSVGCHVVLVDGDPLLPAGQVASLLAGGQRNGHFRETLSSFATAALLGKLRPEEIEAEAMAQMQRIRSAGVQPSHIDSHKHAHMFPPVLGPLLRAACSKGVRAVRNPFGALSPMPFSKLLSQRGLWTRFAQMSVLRGFAANFRAEVKSHGLRTTDGSLGVLVTGTLDQELFASIADSLPEGTWEFVCHPGYNDADLDNVRTRLRLSRAQELEVLTSAEAKQALERRGIELISYHDL